MRNTLKFLVGAMCCTTIFDNYGYSVESSELETPNYVHDNEANINMNIEELSNYISDNTSNIEITNDNQLDNFSTAISLAGVDYHHFFDANYLSGYTPIDTITKESYSKNDIVKIK